MTAASAAGPVLPEAADLPPIAFRSLLRDTAPGMVRDGVGPFVLFYAGWRLGGLTHQRLAPLFLGIALATVAGIGLYLLARHQGREGALARMSLVLVLSDAPMVIAMITWSVWYSVRSFRRSAEWGQAIAVVDAARRQGNALA